MEASKSETAVILIHGAWADGSSWSAVIEQLQAEGLRLARDGNSLVPQLFGLFFHGLTLSGQGQYDRALSLFREGVTLAERVGDETRLQRRIAAHRIAVEDDVADERRYALRLP